MKRTSSVINAISRYGSKTHLTRCGIVTTFACTALALMLLCSTGCREREKKHTGATAQYNMTQQIFCLNMLSNISAMYNGMTDSAINALTRQQVNAVLADPTVTPLIGNWQCVWGPVVITDELSTNNDTVAINTMFIAKSLDSANLYVVAIAGTNSASDYDWTSEDMDVFYTRRWDSVLVDINDTGSTFHLVDHQPFISRATFHGLRNIMNLVDTFHGAPITAYNYLAQWADSTPTGDTMRIWTTGHSLGGALAPAMALYLNNKIALDSTHTVWHNKPISVNCLAVAGATPGNYRWAQLYEQGLGANTIRVWNSHDVVPHGFDTTMLPVVDTIYDPIPTPANVQHTVDSLKDALNLGAYYYTQLYPATNIMFTSALYDSTNIILPAIGASTQHADTADTPNTFITQLPCQHIPAYPHFFGVDTFQYRVQTIAGFANPYFSYGYYPATITATVNIPAARR